MRPPHLTTELDALFLRVLGLGVKIAGDTMPDEYRGIAVGLLSGEMNMYQIYVTYPSLRGTTSVWALVDSALNCMAPVAGEMEDGHVHRRRAGWDRSAFRLLNQALHELNTHHETRLPSQRA